MWPRSGETTERVVQGRGSTMAAFDSSEKHDFLDDL
jgi:hypothetical protein